MLHAWMHMTADILICQAVPAENQRLQRYKDLLLDNTEKVLLSVHPVRAHFVPWTHIILETRLEEA